MIFTLKRELDQLPDEELQHTVRFERIRQRALPAAFDLEESEAREDVARMILASRHPLGTAGREGLPDQG